MTPIDGGSLEPAARAILASVRARYDKPVTIVPADPEEFGHLDLDAYRRVAMDLGTLGFRHLGDLELREASTSPDSLIKRTMIRQLSSTDGHILVGYYDVRPRVARILRNLVRGLVNLRWIDAPRTAFTALKSHRVFDLGSELSNGHFVVTSNAEAAGLLESPPTIDSTFFPYGTPANVLLQAHERRLRARLNEDSTLSVVPVTTLEEARASELRAHAQKMAYRASVQWVSRAELRALSSNDRLADQVFEQVQALLRRQHSGQDIDE